MKYLQHRNQGVVIRLSLALTMYFWATAENLSGSSVDTLLSLLLTLITLSVKRLGKMTDFRVSDKSFVRFWMANLVTYKNTYLSYFEQIPRIHELQVF